MQLTALRKRRDLLTGSMTAKEKRLAYRQIENHEADIIVGTRALIQEKVVYDKLALVITDDSTASASARGRCWGRRERSLMYWS